MRQIAGRCASSSVGHPLLSQSDRGHVGYKFGLVTRTLRRTGTGTRKPGRSRTHDLRGISQSTPSMRRPTPSSLYNSFSELGILGFGLLIDGNIGVGILPESQEIFVPLAGGNFVAHHFLRPGHLQMC
jgi:hypothetical protein